MHDELEAAFNRFADDPKQYVCIVTGAGEKAFCASSDLHRQSSVFPDHGSWRRRTIGFGMSDIAVKFATVIGDHMLLRLMQAESPVGKFFRPADE